MRRRRLMRRAAGILALAPLVLVATSSAQRHALVVHLPSTPVETVSQQALAINELAAHLAAELPELNLESKIFRRAIDASDFVSQDGDESLVLCDTAFLQDLEQGSEYLPLARFQSSGKSTYHRLIVAPSDAGYNRLSDLKGKRITAVEVTSGSMADHLRSRIFANQLEPESWFSEIRTVSDDFSATAEVLFGQTEAAVVAEFNPQVQKHLGQELTVLYESPELLLPVLAIRRDSLAEEDLQRLRDALATMNQGARGQAVLAKFGWSGLTPLTRDQLGGPERSAEVDSKVLRILAPRPGAVDVARPDIPAAGVLPFVLEVELPSPDLSNADPTPQDPPSR